LLFSPARLLSCALASLSAAAGLVAWVAGCGFYLVVPARVRRFGSSAAAAKLLGLASRYALYLDRPAAVLLRVLFGSRFRAEWRLWRRRPGEVNGSMNFTSSVWLRSFPSAAAGTPHPDLSVLRRGGSDNAHARISGKEVSATRGHLFRPFLIFAPLSARCVMAVNSRASGLLCIR